jgi:hypothetical protein
MVFMPVIILPQPTPTTSECSTLITYMGNVINELYKVRDRLNETSSNPDEALILIRNQVNEMISEAENAKSELSTIETNAENKANLSNPQNSMKYDLS